MQSVKKKKYLVILILLTAAVVLLAGYFSASQKSAPQYLSKIDKIMFDKKNQSPKFILTLPDKNTKTSSRQESAKDIHKPVKVEKKIETVDDLLDIIPIVSRLPAVKGQAPLPVIEPDGNLVEKEDSLLLPQIGSDGQKPWVRYGRQAEVQPKFYRVAVVLKNIGLDKGVTDAAITAMPSEVALSFSPYAVDAAARIKEARTAGHETYTDLLLASRDVLKSDNGPLAMSLTLDFAGNLERLKKALAPGGAIGGMIVNDGIADQDTREQLEKILQELKNRGVLMVDATSNNEINTISVPGLARKKADIVIDDGFDRESLAQRLTAAERIAQNNGLVVIAATPKPVVITALSEWFKTFSPQLSYEEMKEQNITTIERPFALVPLSNTVVE